MTRMADALCEMEGVPLRHRNRRARKHFPVTAARFREARLSCFLTVEGCADLLRVSVRTVQNWEAGTVRPPYAAYKLMRVLRGGKMLGPEWRGFTVRADRLNTPEGHTFRSGDLAWWSLLVRQAREFRRIMAQRRADGAARSGERRAATAAPSAPVDGHASAPLRSTKARKAGNTPAGGTFHQSRRSKGTPRPASMPGGPSSNTGQKSRRSAAEVLA